MKLTPVFALLTVCAPIVAHAQTDAPSEPLMPLPMAPKTAATSDAFVWRFAPPVGSRWTMRTFTRSISDTTTPVMNGEKAQKINFKIVQKMTADYDVLSRDALGATTIRLTLREMSQDLTLVANGKAIPPRSVNTDPKSVNGATLMLKQSSDGRVWGVVGLRAFQRKMFEANGIGDAATIEAMLNASPMTKDSEMIKSLGMMAGTLPVSPVRLGESWNYDVALPAPLAFTIRGTRTIKALNLEDAVVADSATYGGEKARLDIPKIADIPGFSVDYSHMKGYVKGTSRVQRSSGLPLETNTTQTITGSVSGQMPARNGRPAQKNMVPINATIVMRVVMEPRLDNSDQFADE